MTFLVFAQVEKPSQSLDLEMPGVSNAFCYQELHSSSCSTKCYGKYHAQWASIGAQWASIRGRRCGWLIDELFRHSPASNGS